MSPILIPEHLLGDAIELVDGFEARLRAEHRVKKRRGKHTVASAHISDKKEKERSQGWSW